MFRHKHININRILKHDSRSFARKKKGCPYKSYHHVVVEVVVDVVVVAIPCSLTRLAALLLLLLWDGGGNILDG
jgi:hypothetical protein